MDFEVFLVCLFELRSKATTDQEWLAATIALNYFDDNEDITKDFVEGKES